jgi:hypothetical protein
MFFQSRGGINQHASAPSKYASRRRVDVYAMESLGFLSVSKANTNSEASEGESAPVTVVLK